MTGRAEFLSFLLARKIPFVVRVKGDVHVVHDSFAGDLQHCGLRFGETRDWRDCLYHAKERVPVRLVLHWAEPRGVPSYWFLATNLEIEARGVLRIYEKRMWIEESFRDEKWDVCLEEVRVAEASRWERLFLIVGVALLIVAGASQWAEEEAAKRVFVHRDRRKRVMSWFRLGLEYLHRFVFGLGPSPLLFAEVEGI